MPEKKKWRVDYVIQFPTGQNIDKTAIMSAPTIRRALDLATKTITVPFLSRNHGNIIIWSITQVKGE